MRRTNSGKGTAKAIFALGVLAAVAFVAIKTIPVYFHNYQLQDYLRELTVQATVQRFSEEQIRNTVLAKAQNLDLPITREQVKVTAGNRVAIDIDYTVSVDLKVYVWVLHFTPSAENRAII